VTTQGCGRLVLGAALLGASFNLRPTVTSLGPMLPGVIASTGMAVATASVLTTVPAFCFGLFAPLAPRLARRFGVERTILCMVLLLAAGTALRLTEMLFSLFAAAILAGAAIGVVNVLLPALVKRDFPDRAALMSGLYTMVLSNGPAIAAGSSIPLMRHLGSWGVALAWVLPAKIRPGARRSLPGLWRNGLAWQVTLLMGFQSATTCCAFG
jgi:CP family cyanate transporter-like MFS transporter